MIDSHSRSHNYLDRDVVMLELNPRFTVAFLIFLIVRNQTLISFSKMTRCQHTIMQNPHYFDAIA